jgi:hypothetical protein
MPLSSTSTDHQSEKRMVQVELEKAVERVVEEEVEGEDIGH